MFRPPLRASGDNAFYIKAARERASYRLEQNGKDCKNAKKRAKIYYTRPRFDRFVGMWDYQKDDDAYSLREKEIMATFKLRK